MSYTLRAVLEYNMRYVLIVRGTVESYYLCSTGPPALLTSSFAEDRRDKLVVKVLVVVTYLSPPRLHSVACLKGQNQLVVMELRRRGSCILTVSHTEMEWVGGSREVVVDRWS